MASKRFRQRAIREAPRRCTVARSHTKRHNVHQQRGLASWPRIFLRLLFVCICANYIPLSHIPYIGPIIYCDDQSVYMGAPRVCVFVISFYYMVQWPNNCEHIDINHDPCRVQRSEWCSRSLKRYWYIMLLRCGPSNEQRLSNLWYTVRIVVRGHHIARRNVSEF